MEVKKVDLRILTKIDKPMLKHLEIFYEGNLNETRGLFCHALDTIFINLNATPFKVSLSFSDKMFINELSKTITHEFIHKIIRTDFKINSFDSGTEEKICQKMANQIP